MFAGDDHVLASGDLGQPLGQRGRDPQPLPGLWAGSRFEGRAAVVRPAGGGLFGLGYRRAGCGGCAGARAWRIVRFREVGGGRRAVGAAAGCPGWSELAAQGEGSDGLVGGLGDDLGDRVAVLFGCDPDQVGEGGLGAENIGDLLKGDQFP